jgi:hypothetical protein
MEASEAAGRPSLTPELLAASGGIDSAESQLQDNFEPPLVSDRIYTIYSLVDPYTSQIRYVGITSSLLRKRLNKHITVARQGDQRHISRWIQKVLREGKRPLIVGLEKTTDPYRETVWITYYKNIGHSLTNASDGCEGQVGSQRSSETKAKISKAGMSRYKDLTGQVFGRLTVKKIAIHMPVKWECRCNCGREVLVPSISLLIGKTRSCGCLASELASERSRNRRKHGMWRTSGYHTWIEMVAKCHNISHARYAKHGGKGITVCDRWRQSFSNFYDDMGARPTDHVLGKKDREGDFSPENCCWETRSQKQQAGFHTSQTLAGKTDL